MKDEQKPRSKVINSSFAVLVPSVKSVHIKHLADDWSELKQHLLIHTERDTKHDGALYSAVSYLPNTTRGNRNVTQVNALVIDLDGEALDNVLPKLDGLEWIAYTTWSHKEDDPHWHLVLPLAHPVSASQWISAWTEAHERLGLVGDPATKDVARIFYLPQHSSGADWRILHGDGEMFVPVTNRAVVVRKTSTPTLPEVILVPDSFWLEEPKMDEYRGLTKHQQLDLLLEKLKKLAV